MKVKVKKFIAFLMLILTIFSVFSNTVFATEISSADLKYKGDCGYHLQYWDKDHWSYIITSFVTYSENGKEYPAYCLNRELPGVGTEGIPDYSVNINSIIEDERLWRTVINGYPYQTPASMGVENEYDAFVATKQAIYSVIYGTDVESFYRGGDSRGVAIKNAIVKLVDIGRNGTQTRYNTDVEVNKTGGFYEDGEYYSQNYNVNAPVEISQYTVINTAGMPDGAKITDLSGNEKTTFGGNETFKVMIPKSQLTKDINVTVSVKAKCKVYPVFYGETTIPGTQNYLVTYDPFGDVAGRANMNVATNTGKIEIVKTDDETFKPIEGVTFGLYKKDGTEVARATTDSEGIAVFQGLYQNDYVLKELETNKDYVLSKVEFDVNVEYNKTTRTEIENEHKKGNLKIYKVDKDNHKIALGNVSFDLYSKEFEKVIGTYATNVDGEIYIENLRTGDYSLIEKNTGKWYNLAEDTEIKVEWNETTETTIENELKKGRVKVIKVDNENSEIKLAGVEFEVLDKDGNVLEKITTNEQGEAYTSRYAIRDYQNLYLHEIKTNEYYKLNDKQIEVELKANQITTVTVGNDKKKGQVEVIKVDKDNNEIKIPDVTFEVYDEENNLVDTLVTDKEGKAVSKLLPIDQEYTIKETITGNTYVLNEEPQKVTLKEDEITSIIFENEKKKGQIKVIKTDGETEVPLQDVTFIVENSKGEIVDRIITDENGEATSKRLAVDEQYTVYEEKTKKGYILSNEKQVVELKENEITDLKFNNYKEKGSIKITKVSSDGNNIAGIEFKITGTSLTGETFEATYKTNENGEIFIDEVLTGEYTIEELQSELNSGYIIPEAQTVTVENDKTSEVEFYNQLIETPKTDDGRNITLAIIVAVISLLGITTLAVMKTKKKNK